MKLAGGSCQRKIKANLAVSCFPGQRRSGWVWHLGNPLLGHPLCRAGGGSCVAEVITLEDEPVPLINLSFSPLLGARSRFR